MAWRRRSRVSNQITGGLFFSAVIQGRDITVQLPHELTPAMAGLREASAVFAGRTVDLERLTRLLDPAAESALRTTVVTGAPGVGKTELALHGARAALQAGWFPGGVLFIDMFGYDPERTVTAAAALESLLRKAGLPAEHIPAAEQDRSALLRSILTKHAEEGLPVLVVVDNVATSAQAAPLIPAAGRVIVTSRHWPPLQNARKLELKKLSQSAASDLLEGSLKQVDDSDIRVRRHPADAVRIARLCDGLPLALQIVGALLAAHPTRPLSTMADDLQATQTRLDRMRFREPDGTELGVRVAFDLSYRQLDANQARVFQLLPLNPGPEVSTAAVVAMAHVDKRAAGLSLDEGTVRLSLDELERAHLIEAGSADGRWRMHDLLRVYASGLELAADEKRIAALMLLAHYSDNAQAAALHLGPKATHPSDTRFADHVQALAWLDTEYPNLLPFGNLVIVSEPPIVSPFLAVDLFLSLWRYFELRRLTDDWIRLTEFALAVARGLHDRNREADALSKLSGAFRQARRFDDAVQVGREAIGIQRDLGNVHSEGIALNNLAAALVNAKRYDEAIAPAQEATAIFEEAGDRYREGIAASHLGGALTGTGQHAAGAAAYEKAAAIFHEAGDQRGEGSILSNLGRALHQGGRNLDEVIDLHRRSVASMEEADDRHGQGGVLINLTGALLEAGHIDEGITAARDSVALLRDAQDRHTLGMALESLGVVLLDAGEAGEAAKALREAVTTYRSTGDQVSEAGVQIRLGGAMETVGDQAAAISAFRSAARIGRRTANQGIEGRALGDLGRALWKARRSDNSMAALRAAVAASRSADDRDIEARNLALLGSVMATGGDIDAAITTFRDAVQRSRQAGNEKRAERALTALQGAEAARQGRDEIRARLAAGRFEDVIADYRSSSVLRGDQLDIAGHMAADLGRALLHAGRFGEAISVLEEAGSALHETGRLNQERAARADLDAARQAQAAAQAAANALERAIRSPGADGPELQTALDEASRHLGRHDARFFRLMSANPGPDISLGAAAILAAADPDTAPARLNELTGLAADRNHKRLFRRMSDLYRRDEEVARGALRVLTQMRLVDIAETGPQRWRLPDAVQPFATQLGRKHAKRDLRAPMRTLLHLYYLAGAQQFSASLDSGVIAPALRSDQAPGLRWLTTEYLNLIATVREAGGDSDSLSAVIALDLTRSLAHIAHRERRFADLAALGPIARRAARKLHDRHAEAVVLRNLGIDLRAIGRTDEAIAELYRALAIYQDLGDVVGEGTTLTSIGDALTQAGQFAEAKNILCEAIEIHHSHGRDFSEAVARVTLANVLKETGEPEAAIVSLTDADKIYRKIGDQHSRAQTLTTLADALRDAGQCQAAIRAYRQSATLARLSDDRPLAAAALTRLAELHEAAGSSSEANSIHVELAELGSALNIPAARAQSDLTVFRLPRLTDKPSRRTTGAS